VEAFSKYALGMAWNYPINVVFLFAMRDIFLIPIYIASPLTSICLVAWNYIISRWAIQAHKLQDPGVESDE
jgi:putative flippase GtrA